MTLFGYGKILDVDLSSGEIKKHDIAPEFARNFVGGMGFGLKILYDEVGPTVDPYDPENVVILSNGPLTGTAAPCSGRLEITTKSPLTGSVGTGNTGGVLGKQIKQAGYDVIITRNKAEKPVYIWIQDDLVEIRDAAHLWGKDTRETTDILNEELGASTKYQLSVLAIGPAGENLVRYACPLNDYYHVAARGGAGGVMGSKNLKAIVAQGSGSVAIARPEEFQKASNESRKRLLEAFKASSTFRTSEVAGAPLEPREADFKEGSLPAKNFQTGVLPDWLETRGHKVAQKYFVKKEGGCYKCPTPCFDLVKVNEGKHAGTIANRGTMPGVVFEFGAKCAIDNLPAIWKCKEICQRLGMDYDSAGGSIAFAMELYQRGIITSKETDGLELTWGNEDAAIELLHKIANRDGFGNILAEGSANAAKIIGKGAERYVMAIKGMEMAMLPDPRSANSQKGWILGSLTNPRGGDNIKNTHFRADKYNPNWWVDKFDMFEDEKEKIYGLPIEDFQYRWAGKALMCRWHEDLISMVNALGLCIFPSGMYLAWGPDYLSRMLSACTGIETTPEDLMKLGERIFTLMKVHTMRAGLSRKDDTWPDRFFEEQMPEGPAKGAILDKEIVDQVLDEYYELRGWDIESGVPTPTKLTELGLARVIDG